MGFTRIEEGPDQLTVAASFEASAQTIADKCQQELLASNFAEVLRRKSERLDDRKLEVF